MAAATTAITAGIGAATSIFQIAQGAKNKREAKEALANYERQELENVYEDLQISTVGSDLLKDRGAATTAALVDLARTGGSRGVMSSLPKIQAESNNINNEAMKYLDDQVNRRNYAIAGDNQRIQGMIEQRQNSEIAGLGQQLNVGNQTMWNGMNGLGNSLIYGANNIDSTGESAVERGQVSSVVSPGLNAYSNTLLTQNNNQIRSNYLPTSSF